MYLSPRDTISIESLPQNTHFDTNPSKEQYSGSDEAMFVIFENDKKHRRRWDESLPLFDD